MLSQESYRVITRWIAEGDYGSAIQHCQTCIEANPGMRAAYGWLGLAICLSGSLEEAQSIWFSILCEASPGEADAWLQELVEILDGSAILCTQNTQFHPALILRQQIIALLPDQPEPHRQLGIAWEDVGNLEEASLSYHQAIALRPDLPDAYNNLALIAQQRGDVENAIAYFQKSLNADPNFFKALSNMGLLLQKMGQPFAAIAALERAHHANPESADVVFNLGFAFISAGNTQLGIHYFRQRLNLQPPNPQCHAALIFCMLYEHSAAEIYAESRQWAAQYAPPQANPKFRNPPDPNRRLRIGYVSPDFRQHSVAYFLEPILKHHNADNFEIFAYAEVSNSDRVTARFQALTPHWFNSDRRSDAQLIEQIQADQVDILIDLAGYSRGNRLPIFGHKPAPIQVSYLGYAATSGLTQMDYRLTDAWADPVSGSQAETIHTEALIRLPESFLCYQPASEAPEVSPLPAARLGYVTFGSFNHCAKITTQVISAWAEILRQVPTARLLLKNEALRDPKVQIDCIEKFVKAGIDRDRIQYVGYLPSLSDHLSLYQHIDIGLDTFPYAGTTTTCEAMWMGVPVVTVTGEDHRSRVGVSLLSNVGLAEWIAPTQEAYVDQAVQKAQDIPNLAKVRASLRSRMQAAPLCDADKFVQNLEEIYRQIWQNWCTYR